MTYAYLIVANHEMYAVVPGWRLLAIDTLTGAAFEMVGGFSSLRLAVACRAGFLAQGTTPDDAPAEFQRLSADALVVHETPLTPQPAAAEKLLFVAHQPAAVDVGATVDRQVSFSLLLPLPSAKVRAAQTLFHDFAAEVPDAILGFDAAVSLDPPGLVLGSDDGDVEQLVEFIGRCAVRFHLTGRFGFSWSRACSDLRPGGFDGGAVAINLETGRVVDEVRTHDWIKAKVGTAPVPDPYLDSGAHQLDIRPFTGVDSHGFELVNAEIGDVAAVVYDGADRGIGEAHGLADIFATAPTMLMLLTEALAIQGEAYDRDDEVNDTDLVDQIGEWRRKVRHALGLKTFMFAS